MLTATLSQPMVAQNTLNIHSKSGDVVSYVFSEKPVVAFKEDAMVVTTAKVSVEYPLSDVDKWTFENSKDALERVITTGLRPDGKIRVYNLSGKLMLARNGNTTMRNSSSSTSRTGVSRSRLRPAAARYRRRPQAPLLHTTAPHPSSTSVDPREDIGDVL